MRILVSNDDGIDAPGLEVAVGIARALTDDVWVVAPETEQSGMSHSLTLTRPLRARSLGDRRFAVSGTPTDCVLLAVQDLMKDRRPDLVLSGVNNGANLCEDVTYSGTVAAAMEGTLLGIPSIALSQRVGNNRAAVDWACPRVHGPALVRRLLDAGWPPECLINVNFPRCAPDRVKGVRVARQGRRTTSSVFFDARTDARGNDYFWLGYRHDDERESLEGTDLDAVLTGAIAVTPLHLDLTHHKTLEALEGTFASFALDGE